MNILVICDSFPPMNKSASVQMKDLVDELQSFKKNNVTVLTVGINSSIKNEDINIIRVPIIFNKNYNKVLRFLSELLMPFIIFFSFNKSILSKKKFDLLLWYSPSIFLVILVKLLLIKNRNKNLKKILIVRDIFPRWALDLKLIKKNIAYFILEMISRYQYRIADFIAIQSKGNLPIIIGNNIKIKDKIFILDNWLTRKETYKNCIVPYRKILIYSGNLGVAQNIKIFLDFAINLKNENFIFLFVGGGSDYYKFKNNPIYSNSRNIFFIDKIENDKLIKLYSKCYAGIVSLNINHTTHNIPGKYISYLAYGLPVFCNVNSNNDLINIINENKLGICNVDNSLTNLQKAFDLFIELVSNDKNISLRCKEYYQNNYTTKKIANEILSKVNFEY